MYPHFLVHYGAFPPRRVGAAPGETLYQTLERNGLPIRSRCRGSTLCGLCWVEVLAPVPPPRPDEAALLARHAPTRPGVRLACTLTLAGHEALPVRIPSTEGESGDQDGDR